MGVHRFVKQGQQSSPAARQRPNPTLPHKGGRAKTRSAPMPWPHSQDYNEAIQNPAQCFSDPELKQGEVVTNALGLPVPYSGNFADVYAVQSGQRKWAVKCFTRQIPGLSERYAEIGNYLQQKQLPFMVEFQLLEQGIQV